jgi:hypothetical protein
MVKKPRTAPRRVEMYSSRKAAAIVGALFLIALVADLIGG